MKVAGKGRLVAEEPETAEPGDFPLTWSPALLAKFHAEAVKQPSNGIAAKRPYFALERKDAGLGMGSYRVVARVDASTYPLTDWDVYAVAVGELARLADLWVYVRGGRPLMVPLEHEHQNYTGEEYDTLAPEAVRSGAFRGGVAVGGVLHIEGE